MNFKGKIVLVTGSSHSLGAQIVKDFIECGAEVIINYNNSKKEAILLKEELEKKYNKEILTIKCDITNEDEVIDMTNKIIDKYKGIDILVNNAGICNDTLFENKTKESFLKVLETNVIGTYLVTKHVAKYLNDNGRIINIASDNGLNNGYPESCDYDASKAGVISLSSNFAKLLSPIRVNTVCPGWIDTDMNKGLTEKQKSSINQTILLNRFATKKEISNVTLFLASDNASYINDSIITVNGGTK